MACICSALAIFHCVTAYILLFTVTSPVWLPQVESSELTEIICTAEIWKFECVCFLAQGKAGDSMAINDNNDGAGYPLFTFVDENIFKKETFLGKCLRAEKSQ